MKIQIVQDLICPWCRIGHHNLEQALSDWSREHTDPVTIEWLPYQLDPLPEGAPKEDFRERFIERKGLAPDQMRQMFDRVTEAGASVGLVFNFDKVTVAVDTMPGHIAIAATPQAKQPALVAALHTAYFENGQDIGEEDTIVACAVEAGLDATEIEAVRAALASPDARADQRELARAVQEAGITSVPYFVFESKLALAGGQPVAMFLRALEQASTPVPVS